MIQDEFEKWVDNQNRLVIGEDAISYYMIVNSADGETIDTFLAPGNAEQIRDRVDSLSSQLPTGRNHVKVIAFSQRGAARGNVGFNVQGTSAGAKVATQEHIQHAKALQMNVNTAEQQLTTMSARTQAADQRALDSEERASNLLVSNFEMLQLVQKLILEKEGNQCSMIEAQARGEALKGMAKEILPPLVMAGTMAFEYFKAKREKEQLEIETLKANLARRSRAPRTKKDES